MAAAHIQRRHPGLLLFQHRNDLFLAEPAPLQIHPTPSRAGLYSNLEESTGSDHPDTIGHAIVDLGHAWAAVDHDHGIGISPFHRRLPDPGDRERLAAR